MILVGHSRPLFCLLSFFLLNVNCTLQQDSNSDHWTRGQSCQLLDHLHGKVHLWQSAQHCNTIWAAFGLPKTSLMQSWAIYYKCKIAFKLIFAELNRLIVFSFGQKLDPGNVLIMKRISRKKSPSSEQCDQIWRNFTTLVKFQ